MSWTKAHDEWVKKVEAEGFEFVGMTTRPVKAFGGNNRFAHIYRKDGVDLTLFPLFGGEPDEMREHNESEVARMRDLLVAKLVEHCS